MPPAASTPDATGRDAHVSDVGTDGDRRPGRQVDHPDRRWALVVALAAVLGLAVGVLVGWSASDRGGRVIERGALDAGPVEIGFLQDMLDHHEQIVRVADHVVVAGGEPAVRQLAYRVVADQRREMGALEAMLLDRGSDRGAPDRQVMGWMGEPVAIGQMPGALPDDEVAAMLNTEGQDLDRRFLDALVRHHEGGIHMAEQGALLTADPQVRSMAGRMAVHQREEILEAQAMLGG